MVNDGDSILGEVDIKLHVCSTLQEHHWDLIQHFCIGLCVGSFGQSLNWFPLFNCFVLCSKPMIDVYSVTYMLSSTFERGDGVLPDSVMSRKCETKKSMETRCRMCSSGVAIRHSLCCMRASGSSMTNIYCASLLPVLCETGTHVTLLSLDGPDHQIVNWNRRNTECRHNKKVENCGKLWDSVFTSDFPDCLSGVSPHDWKCDDSVVPATLWEGRGEEAGGAHVSWMSIAFDNMCTQVFLSLDPDNCMKPDNTEPEFQ